MIESYYSKLILVKFRALLAESTRPYLTETSCKVISTAPVAPDLYSLGLTGWVLRFRLLLKNVAQLQNVKRRPNATSAPASSPPSLERRWRRRRRRTDGRRTTSTTHSKTPSRVRSTLSTTSTKSAKRRKCRRRSTRRPISEWLRTMSNRQLCRLLQQLVRFSLTTNIMDPVVYLKSPF